MSVFGITLLSIKRRMPQIIKASCTTLAAVFFVTAVLIFQENMYQWQMSSNKSRFGDWFLCEVTSKEPNKSLSEHAYLNPPVKAVTCVDMFNQDWKMTGYILGSFDEAFVKQGRLKLDEGHLPENDDEIAMDWNTLLSLGYVGEIGETITIRYCEENSVYNASARQERQFRLCGIFANYTSIWKYGRKMPGAVVTENALSVFNTKSRNSYLYSLKESVRTSDYNTVYKKIKEDAKTETEYNSAVYDYQPWSSALVYAYMYIVVMVIGILALSYQLIEYRGRRQTAYQRFRRLGMDKSMMRKMYITENALIIIPAGIVGLILALLTGFAIGKGLEIHNGFHFYKITAGIIIKSVCSVIAAIVVEELAGLIANRLRKHKGGKKKVKSRTHESVSVAGKPSRIKPANLVRTISSRLMRRDGIFMAVGLRAFALCICGILVFSALMIRKSYTAYKANNALPDIYGYLDPTDSVYEMYIYYYAYVKGFYNIPEGDDYSQERSELLNNPWKERNRFNISFGELKNKLKDDGGPVYSIKYNDEDLIMLEPLLVNYLNRYCKRGNTNLLDGFTEEFLAELDNIGGIQSISYSAFESERTWFWDNQDYHKMGLDTISPDNGYGRDTPITDYGYRYIYSTEYVNPTKELYNKLEKYIDKKYRNYDDFVNGRQVVKDVSYLNPEHVGDVYTDRRAIFDVYCEGENGEKFIVEMQNAYQTYFKDRSLFYSTFPIREQAPKGSEWDFKLNHVYTVALLNFNMNEDAFDKEKIRHHVQLCDTATHKIFYDKLEFIYVEIAKFNKTLGELETLYEKWLYALKNLYKLTQRPKELCDKVFDRLFEEAEIAKFTPQEIREYEASKKAYRDIKNSIDTAKQEGLAEGMELGMEKGMNQKALDIARKMLSKGMEDATIMEITGLTREQLMQLK